MRHFFSLIYSRCRISALETYGLNVGVLISTTITSTWEKFGATKVGIIPRAGRLRRADGSGEEYVDICVLYKDFYPDEDRGSGLAVPGGQTRVVEEESVKRVRTSKGEETRPLGERSTAKL